MISFVKDMKRISRGFRKLVIRSLLNIHGNKCCWCGEAMEIPKAKIPAVNLEEMITVEHYFAKELNDIDNFYLWRLSHKRCNK